MNIMDLLLIVQLEELGVGHAVAVLAFKFGDNVAVHKVDVEALLGQPLRRSLVDRLLNAVDVKVNAVVYRVGVWANVSHAATLS